MVAVSSSSLTDNVDQLIEQCIGRVKDKAIANGASSCSLTVVEKCVDPGTGIYIKVVGDPKEDVIEVTDVHTSPDDIKLVLKHKIRTEDNPSWPFENKKVANLDKNLDYLRLLLVCV